ncbi:MAG: hypothetical protein IID40_03380, partial [Planctomycetes bacterium]|nr:hypothetical protein [Planctomycetota bacterium]
IREGHAIGQIIEYAGPAVEALSVDERATMTNMAAEVGAFTGIIDADDKTVDFLVNERGMDRARAVGLIDGMQSDPGAEYVKVIELDASQVRPMVALPGDPGNGVLIDELESPVRIDIALAPDCPLGEHPLRLRTATGISELVTFYVGALPTVAEVEPNDDFNRPQRVSLNTTIAGVITSEDVDTFAIDARAGQRITAEIEAMRLGRTLFDPYVAILDDRRFELAATDDSVLLLQDSVASIIAPTDGQYVIQVREASYEGSDACAYRLHIGTYPRPTVLYPAGGPAGEALAVQCLGDAAGSLSRSWQLPDGLSAYWPVFVQDDHGTAPSANVLRISPFANVLEPDAAGSQPDAPPGASTPPVAFNGIISVSGQQDAFRFHADGDQQFDIAVYARRIRSPLDSVLNVYGPDGKHLAGNDDADGPDSTLRFRAPTSGDYELRVKDHLGRGGPTFVYRVEVDHIRPSLSLTLERVDTRRPQFLQTVPVPQGNRYGTLVRVERKDVAGPVALAMNTLPTGVTMSTETVAADVQQVPVVFESSADAPIGGGLYALHGRIKTDTTEVVGAFRQEVPLVIGPPNDTVYYRTTVDRLAVAVTRTAPFAIDLLTPGVPLVRGGAISLKVVARRVEGFDGEIEFRLLWNPPGISSPTSIKIPPGATEAICRLNAAGNASTRVWPIALTARASGDGGDLWVSTALVRLEVADPFVTGTLAMAAVEQGQTALVVCQLDQHQPFEGQARIRLLGLPPKTRTDELHFTAQDTQVVFPVQTEADAPVGQHKNLFCQAVIEQNGQPIVHHLGHGGVLRIDPPKVAAAAPPSQPIPAAEVTPAPPKPLSRLEQLRQAAREKAQPKAENPAP